MSTPMRPILVFLVLTATMATSSCIDVVDQLWFSPEVVDAYHWPHNQVPKDHIELVELQGDALQGDENAPILFGVWLHACSDSEPENCPAAPEYDPARRNKTVLYFHGQSNQLGADWDRLQILWRMGYRVFAVDYRGYGRSTGEPSESGLYADSRTALRHVLTRIAEETGFEGEEGELPRADVYSVIYYGRSLGSAVAIELATEFNPAALVAESPLASAQAFVDSAGGLGISSTVLMESEFDSLGRIPFVLAPKLVMHGVDDDFVLIDFGLAVYEAASDPKQFFAVEGAGHGGVPCPDRDESQGSADEPCIANTEYIQELGGFLEEYLGP